MENTQDLLVEVKLKFAESESQNDDLRFHIEHILEPSLRVLNDGYGFCVMDSVLCYRTPRLLNRPSIAMPLPGIN